MNNKTKEKLYESCQKLVDDRIKIVKEAIQSAQESANAETKSTAGDKHDTSRAMMQLEVEQKSKQLSEAEKLQQILAKFNPDSGKGCVGVGSLVITNTANYYISVSVGKIEIDGVIYFAVSPISPVAQALLGKKKGDDFTLNGAKNAIKEVL